MKHNRFVRLAIVMIIIVVALSVFAPAAFAGRVTRIAYNQSNTDTYLIVPTSTQAFLSVTVDWGGASKPVYPVASINAFVQTHLAGGAVGNIYEDMVDGTLYDATINPVTNATKIDTVQNQQYWITIEPYIGDAVPYTLTVELRKKNPVTPAGTWYGKDGLGTPSSKTGDGLCIWTATGIGYASHGSLYKDASYGQFYEVGQYWPGTMAAPNTNWNLYLVARDDYNGGNWADSVYPLGWESNTAHLYTGNGNSGADMATAYMDNVGYANEVNQWYENTPQTWSTATNVGDPWTGRGVPVPGSLNGFTYYPKPQSKTWAQKAALSQTYSFTQSTRVDRPGYMWGGVSVATASKRHFVSNKSPASAITWRYQGPTFNWVFNSGTKGGIARVTVDGVEITPTGSPNPDVDQYSAATVWQVSKTFNVGGAATTWHEVSVKGTNRTSVPGTTKYYFVYHDKFVDPDGGNLGTSMSAEDNYDGMTGYAWDKLTVVGPSGGAFMNTADPSGSTAFTFQTNNATQANRKIKWMYSKGPRCGIQNVYIDGKFAGTVDQVNATVAHNFSTTWTDGQILPDGTALSMAAGTWHTIFITGKGTTNSTSLPLPGYFIYSDAFQAEAQTVVEAEWTSNYLN